MNIVSVSETGSVVSLRRPVKPAFADNLRAVIILRENLQILMERRGVDQPSLARWCGHKKSWINKFLNDKTGKKELQLKDLDRISDVLGVLPYQLFQPGMSNRVERRFAADRRGTPERRIGPQGRELAGLRTELGKLPAVAHGSALAHSAAPDPVQHAIDLAVQRFAREIHALQSGRQAPDTGPTGARVPKDRRKHRRSVSKPA